MTKERIVVRSDRHLTVRITGSKLNLNHQTVHDILIKEFGMRTLWFCVTTTFPLTLPSTWSKFWTKTVLQCFRRPHSRLIYFRVTFSSSRNSNSTWNFVILELRTTFKGSWWTSWGGHFRMKTSNIATGSGNNFSWGVWLHNGTNVKGMMLIFS
jgi:hypothetical protein